MMTFVNAPVIAFYQFGIGVMIAACFGYWAGRKVGRWDIKDVTSHNEEIVNERED